MVIRQFPPEWIVKDPLIFLHTHAMPIGSVLIDRSQQTGRSRVYKQQRLLAEMVRGAQRERPLCVTLRDVSAGLDFGKGGLSLHRVFSYSHCFPSDAHCGS